MACVDGASQSTPTSRGSSRVVARPRGARRHGGDDALEVVQGREFYDDLSPAPPELDLDPGLEVI